MRVTLTSCTVEEDEQTIDPQPRVEVVPNDKDRVSLYIGEDSIALHVDTQELLFALEVVEEWQEDAADD